MPESPEVCVVSDVIRKGAGKTFTNAEVVENVPGKLHRFSNTPIPNFDLLQNLDWMLTKVRTKGKLLILEIELLESGSQIFAYSTLGMSGSWKWGGRKDKHTRLTFTPTEGLDLSFEDTRCYGTFRVVVDHAEAREIERKIGWDLLQSEMPKWENVQKLRKFKNKPIGEILLDQSIFSGIGNIYKSEILYDLKINPEVITGDLSPNLWAQINESAHRILVLAYQMGGSSVVDFVADGKEGNAQDNHVIYMKHLCPEGHTVKRIEQAGRTTHFCPTCQTEK